MKRNSVDILLPCFNEEKTIGTCIKRIKKVMDKTNYNYHIIVCDNNSSDKSRDISLKEKVKVIIETNKGYGATLMNGINHSKSDYIVMLDSDLSYNEKDIPRFLDMLSEYDFVVGNRFKGLIEKGAMPFSHRYGSRLLTEYGNILFRTKSHDFHCGLRAFRRDKIINCNLDSTGFEFASEMIIKAKLNNLKMIEISTDLFKDGRDRKPHLNTIKDGFRHLHLINKIKFESSFLFRYISLFIILILFMFFSLFFVSLIPNNLIYKNTAKSLDFFEKYSSNINSTKLDFIRLEKCGDIRDISMAYNLDNKDPIDSIIRMSYQEKLDKLKDLKKAFVNKEGKLINYSRYWHGQAMYSKVMLLLMPVGYTMYVLQLLVLLVLLIITIKRIWNHNKVLAISYGLMCLSINIFFTAFSVQYFFAGVLTLLFTLFVIKLFEKKSKYLGVLFAISGALTCFFDFLTCETLVLTIPLFVYAVLSIDNGSFSFKELIKYIFIWGLFYILTFVTKWVIDLIYFGFDYYKVIFEKATIRTNYEQDINYINSIMLNINNLLPFNLFKYSFIVFIFLVLLFIHILLFDYSKYRMLIILCLIPFIRFLGLFSHSFLFNYFTYRCLGILIISIIYILILKICSLFISKYDIIK